MKEVTLITEYTFHLLPLNTLTTGQQKKLVDFALEVCPGISPAYIEKRLKVYDQVILYHRYDALAGMQLINTFTSGADHRFFYLGPLFSRHHVFLPMFMQWLEAECNRTPGAHVSLLTECQNPGIFLLFKALFAEYAYPHIHTQQIPVTVQQAVALFAEKLQHIKGFNPQNLSTVSDESFYSYKKRYDPVVQWMRLRGVQLDQKQNQLLYAFLPAASKEKILEQLQHTSADAQAMTRIQTQLLQKLMHN